MYPNETASILLYLGYDESLFSVTSTAGVIEITRWDILNPPVPPTDVEILAVRKDWAVSFQQGNIYREQEIRSYNIQTLNNGSFGEELPKTTFDVFEETYLKILVPDARNSIDEIETPFWWGLSRLRANRNTLLGHLQTWADDPLKTADDILGFDISGWAGWEIDRP